MCLILFVLPFPHLFIFVLLYLHLPVYLFICSFDNTLRPFIQSVYHLFFLFILPVFLHIPILPSFSLSIYLPVCVYKCICLFVFLALSSMRLSIRLSACLCVDVFVSLSTLLMNARPKRVMILSRVYCNVAALRTTPLML